ncbi:polyphosphate kinase 1 [Pedobacter sp. SYP-B3415]|uniref:polyphosphate kinase 1 n=1 Tax=Pedobacter sp. SYP-B3415 TaxID=2496641 RepID=UPI00101C6820|nr:polyphosphate kinase 1 [Pedobacter sp. SYP-B3415]
MTRPVFYNRDLSWTGFNGRVLEEAGKPGVPLMERIRFLSIFSSNLDEFYRVRMPVVMALHANGRDKRAVEENVQARITTRISAQQARFGQILSQTIIPELNELGLSFHYGSELPEALLPSLRAVFFNEILGLLQVSKVESGKQLPPVANNRICQLVVTADRTGAECLYQVYVPAEEAGRFVKVTTQDSEHIVFIEDIIRSFLPALFPDHAINGAYNMKITRDAELNIAEEYGERLPDILEARLQQRELGTATRLLYEPGISMRHLYALIAASGLEKAMVVAGGRYHNLKDLAALPAGGRAASYPVQQPAEIPDLTAAERLHKEIERGDLLIHTPYQDYSPVLRFFNEAATDPDVLEISVTLYRVATQSKIAGSLITAARNGKRVTVLVELKARFDEANNIRWAKTMKAAGVAIVYSRYDQKVHAKVALIRRRNNAMPYLGLMATGNLNETTARFYTDHILLTADQDLLMGLGDLFAFLRSGKQAAVPHFSELLVAGFNLQERFMELIDGEISEATAGRPARIVLKMNNLEERKLISKLYEASAAGVHVQLIIRSICCLIPGIPGLSENITIRRIVGRYLEHGRIFIFGMGAREQLFLGSADWMNRNIYNRIEVCFPLKDARLKEEINEMIRLQLADNLQAVTLDSELENIPMAVSQQPVDSQAAIYQFLAQSTVIKETHSTTP